MREPLHLGTTNPLTGAQVRGPVWRGRLPRRPYVTTSAPDLGGVAVTPDSPLARLLARLPRAERRLVLAAVQAKAAPRRARMERSVQRRLAALGINPE